MEKYENIVKIEEIRRLTEDNQYIKAIKILDTMDFSKIKSLTDLSIIADVFTQNERYDDAMKILTKIYMKTKTRRILYQLVDLSIKRGSVSEAEEYLERYIKVAPQDFYRFIFRYCIDKINSEPYEILIASLEQLKEYEYIEMWAYELAKLYHKAGMKDKCVRECSDIVLWFGDGLYVEKAKLLKAFYVGEININHMLNTKEKKEAERKLELDKTKDYSSMRSQIDHFLAEDEVAKAEINTGNISNSEEAKMEEKAEEAEEIEEKAEETEEKAEEIEEETELIRLWDENEAFEKIEEANEIDEAEYLDESKKIVNFEELETAEEIGKTVELAASDEIDETVELEEFEEIGEAVELEEAKEIGVTVELEEIDGIGESVEIEITKVVVEAENIEESKNIEAVVEIDKYELIEEEDSNRRINHQPNELNQYFIDNEIDYEGIFGYFIRNNICRKQIEICLENVLKDNTKGRNIVITGERKSGKTVLAKKLCKMLYCLNLIDTTQVAKIAATKLNSINLEQKKDKLINGSLIIEEAGLLDSNAVDQLLNLMWVLKDQLVVILEDKEYRIKQLFQNHPQIAEVFQKQINLPQYSKYDLYGFVDNYIEENNYQLSEDAKMVVQNYIHELESTLKEENQLEAVMDLIQKAKTAADERNKQILSKLIGTRNLNSTDFLFIKTEDFQ